MVKEKSSGPNKRATTGENFLMELNMEKELISLWINLSIKVFLKMINFTEKAS